MIDNILLQNNQSITISYIVTYHNTQLTKIKVQDEDLSELGKPKDGIPDIVVQTNDPCLKTQWISWNTKNPNSGYKEHQDITQDLDQEMNNYMSGAFTKQESDLGAAFTQLNSTTAQSLSTLPGMSTILENWDWKDLFTNGGLSMNLNTNFIDQSMAGVSKILDA